MRIKIRTKIKIASICLAGLCLCLFFILGGYSWFFSKFQLINTPEINEEIEATIPPTLSPEDIEEIDKEMTDPTIENSPSEEIQSAEDKIVENLENNATEIAYNDNVFNILLMGTDHRENVAGDRSDSIILISLNKNTKEIVMTSFLRDSYVQIPGHKNSRLNAAYAYGGADLLIETIEKNFKVDINRYAKVNFYAFMDIIDAVGGIDIEITKDEMKYINDYTRELNWIDSNAIESDVLTHAGKVHLNGKQALGYSRIRYIGSDFGRTERQRKVLTTLLNKVKDSSITELNELLNILLPKITTNITQEECFSLILDAPNYLKYDLKSNHVPYDGTWSDLKVNGAAVLNVDFETNIKNLHRDIYHKE